MMNIRRDKPHPTGISVRGAVRRAFNRLFEGMAGEDYRECKVVQLVHPALNIAVCCQFQSVKVHP